MGPIFSSSQFVRSSTASICTGLPVHARIAKAIRAYGRENVKHRRTDLGNIRHITQNAKKVLIIKIPTWAANP